VVVAREGAAPPTLAELREHGGAALAAYKLPEQLQLRESLPLTAMEKIDRRALAAELEAPTSLTPPSGK
jgi:non-ribosomal peptide synthetase component E (peptide arylation enzyme)